MAKKSKKKSKARKSQADFTGLRLPLLAKPSATESKLSNSAALVAALKAKTDTTASKTASVTVSNAATNAAEILNRITLEKSNTEIMVELHQLVGTPGPSMEELKRICRANRSTLVEYEQYVQDISMQSKKGLQMQSYTNYVKFRNCRLQPTKSSSSNYIASKT